MRQLVLICLVAGATACGLGAPAGGEDPVAVEPAPVAAEPGLAAIHAALVPVELWLPEQVFEGTSQVLLNGTAAGRLTADYSGVDTETVEVSSLAGYGSATNVVYEHTPNLLAPTPPFHKAVATYTPGGLPATVPNIPQPAGATVQQFNVSAVDATGSLTAGGYLYRVKGTSGAGAPQWLELWVVFDSFGWPTHAQTMQLNQVPTPAADYHKFLNFAKSQQARPNASKPFIFGAAMLDWQLIE